MQKFLDASIGGTCIAVGLVILLTPAPLGVPLLLLGLFFLARGSSRARIVIRTLRTRFPIIERVLSCSRLSLPRGARYVLLVTRPRRPMSGPGLRG